VIAQSKRSILLIVALVLAFAGLQILSGTMYAKSNQHTAQQVASVPQLGTYSSPSWWNGQVCDKGHYAQAYMATSWRGIQVCGPYSGSDTSHPDYFDLNGAGARQFEFQCTDLVARYIFAAYGIHSQVANGWQIVDTYTGLPNTPFHKVTNDGSVHMSPQEGDVLSYAATAANFNAGHTAIVTGVNSDGSINIIQQNVNWNGAYAPTDRLTISSWKIQSSTHGTGSIISWMTTRSIPTKVNFSLNLSGIGTNVSVGQNNHPLHPVRSAVVQVRNANNNTVMSIYTSVAYSTTTGLFTGSVTINSLSSGYYTIAVKLSNTLNKLAANWFQPGVSIIEPTLLPLSGDVDGNNVINILDYNDLMSCYGSKYPTCQFQQAADLNDDGAVDGVDYNIIIRSFSGQH
jgi:CHAP domain/Dockerin type I domain